MNPYPLNSELSAGIFESSTLKAGMRAMGLLLPEPPKYTQLSAHGNRSVTLLFGFYRHRQNLLVKMLP